MSRQQKFVPCGWCQRMYLTSKILRHFQECPERREGLTKKSPGYIAGRWANLVGTLEDFIHELPERRGQLVGTMPQLKKALLGTLEALVAEAESRFTQERSEGTSSREGNLQGENRS